MKKLTLGMPIRLKIILLIAVAICTSLGTYLAVGTKLISEDKTSYIYDYNRSQTKGIAEDLENKIRVVETKNNTLAGLYDRNRLEESKLLIEREFSKNKKRHRIDSFIFFEPAPGDTFKKIFDMGPNAAKAEVALTQLGVQPSKLKLSELKIGAIQDNFLPIIGWSSDATGKKIIYAALVNFTREDLDIRNTNLQVITLDNVGNVIVSKTIETEKFYLQQHEHFAKTLLSSEFKSGAQDLPLDQEEYIVSYQRLKYGNLLVTAFISKGIAYQAVKKLLIQSAGAGAIILLISMAFTIFFVRGLTARLKQMWFATKRVAEGDFTSRVNLKSGSKDEINDLAESFNTMADRIDELMQDTATKARMEKELETAQTVQNRFFPTSVFNHPNISLSGRSVPASECGGDWWNYVHVGDYLFVAIGDVTGHGVSSALVTAACHGGFSILVSEFLKRPNEKPDVKWFLENLNRTIGSAGGGDSTMTFLAATINLVTGEYTFANASHRPPYVYKASKASAKNPIRKFKPLMDAQVDALGLKPEIIVEPVTVQLDPGDMVFMFTDGLVECENSKGEFIKNSQMLKMLARIKEVGERDADAICGDLFQESMEFFGEMANHLDDDVTFCAAQIPNSASFQAPLQEQTQALNASLPHAS